MVTVNKMTVKGRNTTVVITPEPTKDFWTVINAYEAPLKARADLLDWDRDGSMAQFDFANGERVTVEYI